AVPGDHSAPLQLLDPLVRRRRRHAHARSDVGVRRAPLALQDLDDRPVGIRKLRPGHESPDDIAGTITVMSVLTEHQLSDAIGQLGPGWDERDGALHKHYEFEDFAAA